MSRRKLTDAELAALPPAKRAATLAKRAQRANPGKTQPKEPALRLAAVTRLVPMGAPVADDVAPPGITPSDERALAMYAVLRSKLQAADRWNDEGCHGMLLTYCQATVEIENFGVGGVSNVVVGAQFKAAAALRLTELPAEKVRAKSRHSSGW